MERREREDLGRVGIFVSLFYISFRNFTGSIAQSYVDRFPHDRERGREGGRGVPNQLLPSFLPPDY